MRNTDLLTHARLTKAEDLLREIERDQVRTDLTAGVDTDRIGMSEREIQAWSFLRAIKNKDASIRGKGRFSGLEGETHATLIPKQRTQVYDGDILIPKEVLEYAPVSTRAMHTGLGSAGGFLVGASIGSFVEVLTNKMVTAALGVQTVSHTGDNLLYPRGTTGPVVNWLGASGSSATLSNEAFGLLSSTPKTTIAIQELSTQQFRQISPAAETFFRAGLTTSLAVAKDAAVINGTGGVQPLGIVNVPGIGTVTGTSLDVPKCVEFQSDVLDNNAAITPAALAYVCPPLTAALLKGRQRFTSVDSTLWKGSLALGEIEGCKAMSTKQLSAGTLLFGDWSTVFIVEFGTMRLQLNPYADLRAGLMSVRAMQFLDVVVKFPLAFSYAASVT
jgi:HK97 family phage major capsid protein